DLIVPNGTSSRARSDGDIAPPNRGASAPRSAVPWVWRRYRAARPRLPEGLVRGGGPLTLSQTSDELLRLQRRVREAGALAGLPALWHGGPIELVAESLASVLFAALQPGFLYVRLESPGQRRAIEVARAEGWSDRAERANALGRALAPWLEPA